METKSMRYLYHVLCVAIYVLTVRTSVSAQELPFVQFANPLGASASPLAFQQNSNKEILLVSAEGIEVFNGKSSRRLFTFAQHGIRQVKQALFSTQQELLVLTPTGLFAINLLTLTKSWEQQAAYNRIFYFPAQNALFALSAQKLYLLNKQQAPREVLSSALGLQNLVSAGDGWVVIKEQQLLFFSKDWALTTSHELPEPIIDSYRSKERLLLLTRQAVYSSEGKSGLKKLYRIKGANPNCMLEDQTGRLWLGTQQDGLLLMEGKQFKQVSESHNFPLKTVKGIYEAPDYAVWFYGPEGLVYKPFSMPFKKWRLGLHLAGDVTEDAIAVDSFTTALITRDGHYHLLNQEGIIAGKQLSRPFSPAFSRLIDKDKLIQLSSDGKLYFEGSGSATLKQLQHPVQQVFAFAHQAMLLDVQGNMHRFDYNSQQISAAGWQVAAGKYLIQSGHMLVYTGTDGSLMRWNSQDNTHQKLNVHASDLLFADLYQQNYLIYLTKKGEIAYAAPQQAQVLDYKLPAGTVVSGFSISRNVLWISAADKLYMLSLGLEDGEFLITDAKVFDAAEYKLELPFLKTVALQEGSFLLASASSFMQYNPLANLPDVSPPGLFLARLSIKSKAATRQLPVGDGDSVRIELNEEEALLINAFAVQYARQHKASLKYRFLSEAHQWHAVLDEETILLADLPEGEHVVELTAENEQGVKSQQRKFILLSVMPAGSYNWWMILAGVASGLLFIYVAYNGLVSARDGKGREAKEKWEKELMKLQRKSHEQMMQAEGLKQVNELIKAQKAELEDKNKQIVAQKYELTLTNSQIKQQKDLIQKTTDSLQSSITYAKRIQTALMGDEIRIKEDLGDSFVFFRPRDQVSGDFFWYQKVSNRQGEERLLIAAVDCTGHGVPGAIVSVVGIQLLNAIVTAKGITDPGQILNELNQDLLSSLNYEHTKINDGMDMSLCSIDLQGGKLYFAGAKNPLFVVEAGALDIIKGDKHAIGGQKLREEKSFQTHEISLKKDGSQMFYLCTDGYQDQFGGESHSKFMLKSFKELLIGISDKPVMEQKYTLAKTITDWQGKEEQTDDMLVLGFRL